jgi:hypothetical protein
LSNSARSHRAALKLLLAGASMGVLLGALSALSDQSNEPYLSATAVASVNHQQIRLAEYQRALGMFASDKRELLTEDDRSLVLQRLIDEELLIQHGITSGLIRTDMAVRSAALESVLAGLMIEIEASSGDGAEKALTDYLAHLRATANIEWARNWVAP